MKILVYCGPSFPGILLQYAVFNKGIPGHIKDEIEKCKEIKDLIVPVKDFNRTRINISRKGTRENLLFNKVLEYQNSK